MGLFSSATRHDEPERYRMPLSFCDGPRHPAPRRRMTQIADSPSLPDVQVTMEVEAPQVELAPRRHQVYVPAAERPLDVPGVPQRGPTVVHNTVIPGLSSRLATH